MDHWLSIFATKLDKARVTIRALMKYVDDMNVVCVILRRGSRWRSGSLVWSKEWEQEDTLAMVPDRLKTMKIIQEVANDVIPWLEFTVCLFSTFVFSGVSKGMLLHKNKGRFRRTHYPHLNCHSSAHSDELTLK